MRCWRGGVPWGLLLREGFDEHRTICAGATTTSALRVRRSFSRCPTRSTLYSLLILRRRAGATIAVSRCAGLV